MSTSTHAELVAANEWLARRPYMEYSPRVTLSMLDGFVDQLMAQGYRGEICWSECFRSQWLALMMQAGFLPIAMSVDAPRRDVVLGPKLHRKRCVMDPRAVHAAKTVRKRARKFTLSVDRCFERVVERVVAQHGENWLFPIVQRALRGLHTPASGTRGFDGAADAASASSSASASAATPTATVHSFELWSEAPAPAPGPDSEPDSVSAPGEAWREAGGAGTPRHLVAGELGYVVGGVYTSLTGFSHRGAASAGAVQLLATARVLDANGFALWDLGMGMAYKAELGAADMPRADFIRALRKHRGPPRRAKGGASAAGRAAGDRDAAASRRCLALPGDAAFANCAGPNLIQLPLHVVRVLLTILTRSPPNIFIFADIVRWEKSVAVRLAAMRAEANAKANAKAPATPKASREKL